jgi:hypothetical protein
VTGQDGAPVPCLTRNAWGFACLHAWCGSGVRPAQSVMPFACLDQHHFHRKGEAESVSPVVP